MADAATPGGRGPQQAILPATDPRLRPGADVTAALPDDLLDLRSQVDAALTSYLDRALPRVAGLHPRLEPAADEIRQFVLGGGKRLRPLFLLAGYVGAGGQQVARVLGPAVALELLHTCALFHDDIIDAAATRRGRPAAHQRFAAHHEEHGYRGDPAAFGRAVAILLGDLALVQADEAFLDADLPAAHVLDGLRVFTTLREEVMAGQYLDVVAAQERTGSRELALAVASYKSGRYTVARPLELGAALAGGSQPLRSGLFAAGLPLGRAFQLRDDLLGVFGTEHDTGKSAASDLAEGKRTLLVSETLERLDEAGRSRFGRHFGDPDLDGRGAQVLRELIATSGGRAAVEAEVVASLDDARARLGALSLHPPADAWLDALVGFVGHRRT